MPKAVNLDFDHDVVVRISAKRNTVIVEEHKADGGKTYKEISPMDLYSILNASYSSKEMMESGLLPENCLYAAMNSAEKIFAIKNHELRADISYKERTFQDFPLPRLVFRVRILDTGRMADCAIGVVADETLSMDSVMYHYPFSNVYTDGKVCTGNNVLPKYKNLAALKHFPRYLMELPDNDDMYSPDRNKLGLGHMELLEHLKDKEPAYYYTDILVPNGKTLAEFLGGR